jgi:hypothetical protein
MGRAARASLISICVGCLVLGGVALPARALETDQFTVPDAPLADIGPELSPYVLATVWDVVQAANAKAQWHDAEARRTPWFFWRDYHRGKAAQYRGEDYLALRVYGALAGGGLPECKIEQWAQRLPPRTRGGERIAFPLTCARAVYGDSLFTKPLFLVDLSPTVNVYGTYMGTDKLGHLFQQGYEYFREFRREETGGGDEQRALARAVRLGVAQESGIFGEALIGVYSNADLAANYAGLKFYLNLTRTVEIGTRAIPPLLARGKGGVWMLNAAGRGRGSESGELLRPFVSDHFNEALNPSRYSDQMRATVRANLRRRADRLVAFYRTDLAESRRTLLELSTWHGEDYGHCRFDRVVTMADNCFPAVAHAELNREAQPASARPPVTLSTR